MFENSNKIPVTMKKTSQFFKDYSVNLEEKELEKEAFASLDSSLLEGGMELASAEEASEILRSESLLCRSENFSKVLDLVESDENIIINNPDEWANMCTVSAGSGFRVAMLEGFSGNDVGSLVKVVVTFSGEHIERTSVPKSDDLWSIKPDTAAVSLVGKGEIEKDDIKMVSFRFPAQHYPEHLLSEEEKDGLEEDRVKFIVRHYIPNEKAAPSYIS